MDLQYEQETLVDAISIFYSLNRFIKSFVVVFFFFSDTCNILSLFKIKFQRIHNFASVGSLRSNMGNSAGAKLCPSKFRSHQDCKICRQRACLTFFCVLDRK